MCAAEGGQLLHCAVPCPCGDMVPQLLTNAVIISVTLHTCSVAASTVYGPFRVYIVKVRGEVSGVVVGSVEKCLCSCERRVRWNCGGFPLTNDPVNCSAPHQCNWLPTVSDMGVAMWAPAYSTLRRRLCGPLHVHSPGGLVFSLSAKSNSTTEDSGMGVY